MYALAGEGFGAPGGLPGLDSKLAALAAVASEVVLYNAMRRVHQDEVHFLYDMAIFHKFWTKFSSAGEMMLFLLFSICAQPGCTSM